MSPPPEVIRLATELVMEMKATDKNITILCDCKAAIESTTHSAPPTSYHDITIKTRKVLAELTNGGNTVQVIWTPGHMGIWSTPDHQDHPEPTSGPCRACGTPLGDGCQSSPQATKKIRSGRPNLTLKKMTEEATGVLWGGEGGILSGTSFEDDLN
ncbi:hypothetical protein Bbelb_199430 [Branchiostoma belcheri]|nr:hypothetical protein Bbelb_199430 [Branchiostoma belcheri]